MSYDPYNNSVTYDEKWETPENKAAQDKLEKKFFDRSYCYPSCPAGWAPEVLEMLETIDREFGIEYNTGTLRSYYIQGKPFEHFVTGPFKNAWSSFYSNFIEPVDPEKPWKTPNRDKPVSYRLRRVFESAVHSIKYGCRAFRVTHINPVLNKILKPKVRLDQIKEKYGELRLYYTAPDYLTDYIDGLVAKCEVKLALKGCYYPVESLWKNGSSWNCGTEYHPEVYSVEEDTDSKGEKTISVTKTSHRTAMKELGINLKEMEQRYLDWKTKRDAEREEFEQKRQAIIADMKAKKAAEATQDKQE